MKSRPSVIVICSLVAPRTVEEMKDGVVWVPNTFTVGQKASIRVVVAANPNLTAFHWTVNGKEPDVTRFNPVSITQTTQVGNTNLKF